MAGWPTFSTARPNAAHDSLAALERSGHLEGVITQNVDGLHQEAGSRRVVELHGSLAYIRCLDCSVRVRREVFQELLVSLNGAWIERMRDVRGGPVESAPDGDADVPAGGLSGFQVPDCAACGGVLKPDVVFFGESVPKQWVTAAWDLLARAEVLLVVGSSLTVFSGRRFVYGARKADKPVAIVNFGPTRADDLAEVKVEARLGMVLPQLARELIGEA